MYTCATAERYNLSVLQSRLPQNAQRFEDAWWVPLGLQHDRECEAWVFGNGTTVCWGLEEDDARRFVEDLLRKAPEIQFAPLTTMETEELEFVIDPAEYVALALLSCGWSNISHL